MFPLSTVLFPHDVIALHVFEPRYRALVADCLVADGCFGVVLIARGSEVGGADERVATGTLAAIEHADALGDGRWHLVARGMHRISVRSWRPDAPYPRADVEPWPDAPPPTAGPGPAPGPPPSPPAAARALLAVRRARALLSELAEAPAPAPDLDAGAASAGAWRLCAAAPVNVFDRQTLLEAPGVEDRLELLADLCEATALDMTRLLSGGGG